MGNSADHPCRPTDAVRRGAADESESTPSVPTTIEDLTPELLHLIAAAAGRSTVALAATASGLRALLAEQLPALKAAALKEPATIKTLLRNGVSPQEIKKLGLSPGLMVMAGNFEFPSGHSFPRGRALCPHCWCTDFGTYIDDESTMGMGRDQHMWCKATGCKWTAHWG